MKAPTAILHRWRFYSILFLLGVFLCLLCWHLVRLQVLPQVDKGHDFLQEEGLERTLRTDKIPAIRGVISDRHGEPLAMSSPVVTLWADPRELVRAKDQWPTLAGLLRTEPRALGKKISDYATRGRSFMFLQRRLEPARADEVLSEKIPGVFAQQEYRRFYPAGEVAAHLLGITNVDHKGQEGLELLYDSYLAGSDGKKRVLKDSKSRYIRNVSQIEKMKPGQDLALSIDLRLQHLAYRELKEAVTAHRATGGSIVLLDVQSGEVLAMANQPSFNPNFISKLKTGALRNRALIDQFEPGSTMKPITLMAALESGRYHEDSVINTHPGHVRVGRKTLLDPVNYGEMDLSKIIQKSSQVGITKISLDLPGDAIRNMFFRLGLGQDTGTGFPGETVGKLPYREKWQPIVQANYAFGYGLTLNSLQLAQAYSVIADGGVKKPVSLLKLDKSQQAAASAKIVEQVVEQKVARSVARMMQSVVQKGGTGTRAAMGLYSAAGKTGTIHKVGSQGYDEERYTALFAGFAPANNPRIVAVVVIDEPKNGQYFGGEVAAPVFSAVVEKSLHLLRVKPDLLLQANNARDMIESRRSQARLFNSGIADSGSGRDAGGQL